MSADSCPLSRLDRRVLDKRALSREPRVGTDTIQRFGTVGCLIHKSYRPHFKCHRFLPMNARQIDNEIEYENDWLQGWPPLASVSYWVWISSLTAPAVLLCAYIRDVSRALKHQRLINGALDLSLSKYYWIICEFPSLSWKSMYLSSPLISTFSHEFFMNFVNFTIISVGSE